MMKIIIAIIILIIILLFIYSILPTCYYRIVNKKAIGKAHDENSILLTFDDGPSEDYTNKLLDLLKKYHVKATFFVIAKEAAKHPKIIERILKEGHSLGLHSLEHKNALVKGYLYTKHDFEESIWIIKSFGFNVNYYRPPWGQVNLFTLYYIKKYNLQLVLWNIMVGDWSRYTSISDIKKRLLSRVKAGSNICLHDGRGSEGAPFRTISALETVIPKLLDRELKFVNIDDFYE